MILYDPSIMFVGMATVTVATNNCLGLDPSGTYRSSSISCTSSNLKLTSLQVDKSCKFKVLTGWYSEVFDTCLWCLSPKDIGFSPTTPSGYPPTSETICSKATPLSCEAQFLPGCVSCIFLLWIYIYVWYFVFYYIVFSRIVSFYRFTYMQSIVY